MNMAVSDQKENHNPRGRGRMRWPWRSDQPRITPTERALIGAQAKALTLLVTALHARGHLDADDFAGTLGIFSVVVAEDDALEGDILAVWAGMLKESL